MSDVDDAPRALGSRLPARAPAASPVTVERLAAIALNSRDIIGIATIDGRVLYMNPFGCELIGADPTTIIGTPIDHHVMPASRQLFRTVIMPALLDEGTWQGNTQWRHLSTGAAIDVHQSVFLLHGTDDDEPVTMATIARDVREERAAQVALRDSEQRFRSLFESAPIGIVVGDTTGRFLAANPAWAEMLGMTTDELRGTTYADVTHPDDVGISDHHRDLLLGGQRGSVRYEKRFVRRDGSVFWGRVTLSLLRDADDQPSRLLALIDDTSGRRRIEELEAAEVEYQLARRHTEQLQGLARAAVAINAARTLQDAAATITREARSIIGARYASTEIAAPADGASDAVVVSEDPADGGVQQSAAGTTLVAPLVDSDGAHLGTLRLAEKSEGEFTAADEAILVQLAHMASVAVEKIRALQETRHNLERLRGLGRASLAIHVPLSSAEIVREVTEQAAQLIGAHQAVTMLALDGDWPRSQSHVYMSQKYDAWRDYLAQPDGTGIYRLVAEDLRPMRLSQAELEAHPAWRNFGGQADVHPPMRGWLAAPLIGRDGRCIGLLQLSDRLDGEFTESDEALLVQLAQVAATAIEKAYLYELEAEREAAAQREQLLAGISHDMQTPLAAILGFAEMLRDDAEAPADEREPIYGVIERQARHLRTLVQQFLDFSRLETDRPLPITLRRVDVPPIVERVTAMFTHARAIALDVPRTIPAVQADADRLEQILTNLVSNAIKYSDTPISLTVSAAEDVVAIEVRDTGRGIHADDLPLIFDRFFRGSNAGAAPGTGLGLHIARAVAEAQGGELTVVSELGRGSTFRLTVPTAH